MDKFWKIIANLVGLAALLMLGWWLITIVPEHCVSWVCNAS